MQGVELPCDWTVNRRPNNSSSGGASQPSAPASKAAPKKPISATTPTMTTAAAVNHNNEPAAPTITTADSGAAAPLVTVNPLGPRTHAASARKETPFSMMMPNHGQVRNLVLQHLSSTAQQQQAADEGMMEIVVENLLSRLPYKKMLSDMFGGTLRGNLQNSHIPYVTRAYEESFMREVQNLGERECARGQQCECMFIDRTQPFVGVEFLLPSEERPPTPHLCVLCCRAITQQLYYDVMFDKADFPGVIQRFGNIHSEPGEYALDAMLIAAPTAPVHVMPLPIVSHQRNRYTVFVQGGIKRLRQSRVYFQGTPSCNADSG